MSGKVLEAKAIITAEDRTGKAFDAIEARVKRLTHSVRDLGKYSSQVAKMGGYVERGDGSALLRSRVASMESLRRHHDRELAEVRKMRREMLAIGSERTGLGMIGGGIAAGFAAHEVARASAQRVHERVRMQASGMSAGEMKAAETEAARLASEFPAVGQTEAMHMLRNARSIVGSYQEAAEIMGPLTKLRIVAQGARPGADVSEDFDQLVKGLEIKGVTQNPKQFRDYMEGIAKGLNVFGDTLKPYQYYEMFKYGRQATPGLSEKFILGTAPTIAQELGGSSYGNAVSGFNRAIVGGRMEHASLKEMARLGLIAKDDLDYLKNGEVKGLKPGKGVKGWQLAQSDPNEWVRKFLLPAMADHGIIDGSKIMKEIGTLFSNKVAAQLVSLLATQQGRIDKDTALLNRAPGLSAADDYARKDPTIAWQGFKNAVESLTGTIGSGIATALAPIMADTSKALTEYNKRINEGREARARGEVPEGQKTLQRLINIATTGVDSDKPNDEITDREKQDAAYRKRRADLKRQRNEKSDIPGTDWSVIDWGLAHPNEPYPGKRKSKADLDRDANSNHKSYIDRKIADLDAAHNARLKAERAVSGFNTNIGRWARFSHPYLAGTPGLSIGGAGEQPIMAGMPAIGRRGRFNNLDPNGQPKIYGPFAPPPTPPAPGPSLSTLLQPNVDKTQVDGLKDAASTAKSALDGLNTTVTPGVNLGPLEALIAKAKEATRAIANLGSGSGPGLNPGRSAPGTGPAGRTPSGL